jgi:hypothetical protein
MRDLPLILDLGFDFGFSALISVDQRQIFFDFSFLRVSVP